MTLGASCLMDCSLLTDSLASLSPLLSPEKPLTLRLHGYIAMATLGLSSGRCNRIIEYLNATCRSCRRHDRVRLIHSLSAAQPNGVFLSSLLWALQRFDCVEGVRARGTIRRHNCRPTKSI